jgi:lipoate synthase
MVMHKLLEQLATERGKTLDLLGEIDASPEIITIGGRVVLKGPDARKILHTLRDLCAANLDLMTLLSKRFIN